METPHPSSVCTRSAAGSGGAAADRRHSPTAEAELGPALHPAWRDRLLLPAHPEPGHRLEQDSGKAHRDLLYPQPVRGRGPGLPHLPLLCVLPQCCGPLPELLLCSSCAPLRSVHTQWRIYRNLKWGVPTLRMTIMQASMSMPP